MEQNSTDGWLTRDLFDRMVAEDDEDLPEEECRGRCDGCGEVYEPSRPNSGDGWGEFYCSHPEVDGLDSVFIGHWQCAQAAGCNELA